MNYIKGLAYLLTNLQTILKLTLMHQEYHHAKITFHTVFYFISNILRDSRGSKFLQGKNI